MRPSATGLALFALLGALAVWSWWRPFGPPVRLAVDAPPVLTLAAGAQQLSLPLVLHLTNQRRQPQFLNAPDCRPFRWLILTERSQFVQSQSAPAECAQEPPPLELEARARHSERRTLVLKAARYRAPQTYRVRVRFWGAESEARFQLIAAEPSSSPPSP